MIFRKWIFLTAIILIVASCNNTYVPKPQGYYKIGFPEKKYQLFQNPTFPFSFEFPTYAAIVRDTSFFGESPENPYWLNVYFPQFDATLFISYKQIGQYTLSKLVNDAFNLTNKHTVKATSIDDSLIQNKAGVKGVYFTVNGNVATARQFFLTDSSHNFVRASLYFNSVPNQDSLKPVVQFIDKDIKHLINTFQWKK